MEQQKAATSPQRANAQQMRSQGLTVSLTPVISTVTNRLAKTCLFIE
jgi:hypothetical protein